MDKKPKSPIELFRTYCRFCFRSTTAVLCGECDRTAELARTISETAAFLSRGRRADFQNFGIIPPELSFTFAAGIDRNEYASQNAEG